MNGLAETEVLADSWEFDLLAGTQARRQSAPRPMRQLIPAVLARYGLVPPSRPLAVSPLSASPRAVACQAVVRELAAAQ